MPERSAAGVSPCSQINQRELLPTVDLPLADNVVKMASPARVVFVTRARTFHERCRGAAAHKEKSGFSSCPRVKPGRRGWVKVQEVSARLTG